MWGGGWGTRSCREWEKLLTSGEEWATYVLILALPLFGCVTLGKFLGHSFLFYFFSITCFHLGVNSPKGFFETRWGKFLVITVTGKTKYQ